MFCSLSIVESFNGKLLLVASPLVMMNGLFVPRRRSVLSSSRPVFAEGRRSSNVLDIEPKLFEYEAPLYNLLRFVQSGCVDQILVVGPYIN